MSRLVAQGRRKAGLTQKDLAQRLSVNLLEVVRIERGEASVDDCARALEALKDEGTGKLAAPVSVELRPSRDAAEKPRTAAVAHVQRSPAPSRIPWRNTLVLGSLAIVVTVRFFTEVVPILPRFLNFADVPIVGMLVLVSLVSAPQTPASRFDDWIRWAGVAFLALVAVATLANLSRVEAAPALTFVYGILSPLVVFLAARRLWAPGHGAIASQLIVVLGACQIVVVAIFGLPDFVSTRDPDLIAGTFGTNAYQLVFFLLLFVTVLIGIRIHEPDRLAARAAPLLIVASLVCIVLAQYRALLLTTFFALVLAIALAGRARGRSLGMAGAVLSALIVVLYVVSQTVPNLKFDQTARLNPVDLIETRLEVLDQLDRLYTDEPRFALTGTGPGTYSSRGWQTFALADSESTSNVQGGYATSLTGGETYSTDVSDEYVLPLLRTKEAVAGSTAVNSPLAEYVAVAAEVGVLGAGVLLVIYGIAFFSSASATSTASRQATRGDPVPALLAAGTVGLFVLLQMGVLQNWLEVTRLTFPTWILLAIGLSEHQARRSR